MATAGSRPRAGGAASRCPRTGRTGRPSRTARGRRRRPRSSARGRSRTGARRRPPARARLPPSSSSAWLPVSASEWTASASRPADQVIRKPTNLAMAMPRLAKKAAMIALRLPSVTGQGWHMGLLDGRVALVTRWRTWASGGRISERSPPRARRSPSTTAATATRRRRRSRRSRRPAGSAGPTPRRSTTPRPTRRWSTPSLDDFGFVDLLVRQRRHRVPRPRGGRHRPGRGRPRLLATHAVERPPPGPARAARRCASGPAGDIVMISSVATSHMAGQRGAVQHGQGGAGGAGAAPWPRRSGRTASTSTSSRPGLVETDMGVRLARAITGDRVAATTSARSTRRRRSGGSASPPTWPPPCCGCAATAPATSPASASSRRRRPRPLTGPWLRERSRGRPTLRYRGAVSFLSA